MGLVYDDILFPECLSYGSTFQPTYEVLKTEVASGAESRQTRQAYVKYKYTIDMIGRNPSEISDVVSIFHVCGGSLAGFMFNDLVDNTSAVSPTSLSGETIDGQDQAQGTYDTGETYYPLLKTYVSGARSKQRRIRYPDVATLLVNVNGTPNFDWAWDATEQAIWWPSNAPLQDDVLTAGYRFFVPVRFDLDSMSIEPKSGLYNSLIADLSSIDLIEVFE